MPVTNILVLHPSYEKIDTHAYSQAQACKQAPSDATALKKTEDEELRQRAEQKGQDAEQRKAAQAEQRKLQQEKLQQEKLQQEKKAAEVSVNPNKNGTFALF